MNPPTGACLFEFLEVHKEHPDMPKHISGLRELESQALDKDYNDLFEYLKSWRLYIEYQNYAEWHVNDEA